MNSYYNSRLLSIYKNDDYIYYNQYLENLFTLSGEFKKVKINNTKNININTDIKSYHFTETDNNYKIMSQLSKTLFNIYIDLLNKNLDVRETAYNVSKILSKYSTNLPEYLYQKKLVKYPISNRFIETYEILHEFPELINNNINAYHGAELPGDLIIALTIFSKKNNIKYKWLASGLKPDNKNNFLKYGYSEKNIQPDKYNLIKTKHFLWGKDKTGDINNIDNLKWYQEYLQKKKLNLITSNFEYSGELYTMQKVDLSQLIHVLTTSQLNSKALSSIWIPYIEKYPQSFYSSGFYMNIIYTYTQYFENVYLVKTSVTHQQSTKIYIIGINFKGIAKKEIDTFYNVYKKYNYNKCWYNKKDMDTQITKSILTFMNNIYNDNIIHTKIKILVLYCYLNSNIKIDCKKYTDTKIIKNYDKIFDKWINKYM
jgi:hypothetical protein